MDPRSRARRRLLSGCGAPEIVRPKHAVLCPANVPARRAFDARELLGRHERAADERAAAHGCLMAVVREDGRELYITADINLRRVQVEVDDGIVTRIRRIG